MPLHPRDGSNDFDGWFPCGRKAGFEGKEFRLPGSLTCYNCILQFIQEIGKDEKIHQCADIIVMEHLTSSEAAALLKEQREGCGGVC